MTKRTRNGNFCFVWTRVSTARQEKDGGSLDYQKDLCVEYARANKLRIIWQDEVAQAPFGGTHESAKVPGALFKEMIKLVKKDTRISKIICSEFDRFSRDAAQAIGIIRELYDLGVAVCSVKQGICTDTKDNIMMASNLLLLATWDNDKRADKFYTGRKHCYEMGAYTGMLPIGYTRIDPKTGQKTKSIRSYCFLDDDGQKIKEAFRMKLQGYTNGEILDALANMGLVISKQTLNHIFNNPFYAGIICSKLLDGGRVEGKIEKAVSYQDWLKVQKIMSDRHAWYKHKKKNEDAPMKGHILCSRCGKPLTAYKQKGHWYYKCNTKGCGFNKSADELHKEYLEVLHSLELPMTLCEQYADIISARIKESQEQGVKTATTFKKERTELEKELREYKRSLALGKIEKDIYDELAADIEERIVEIDEELQKYSENLSNLEKRVSDIVLMCSSISTLWKEKDLETRQRIQNLVFPKKILFDRENQHYRTENRNPIYNVIDDISARYRHKKETPSEEDVSECAG